MNAFRKLMVAGVVIMLAGCAAWQERRVVQVPAGEDRAGSDAAWSALDQDHDGVLTPRELAAQHAVALLQGLPVADADRSGSVSRSEWDAWWPRMTRTPPSPTMQALNTATFAGAGAAPQR